MFDNEYNVKCKVRWVICGYSQIKYVDYFDTYSPTPTNALVFLLLMLCACNKLEYSAFDVSAAFLEGRQDIPQYAWIPEELTGPIRKCAEILGNWYGTKQAPKIWNTLLDKILREFCGFKRCPVQPCLYYRLISPGCYIYLVVHVDDGFVVATAKMLIDELYKNMREHIKKMTDSNTFQKYLGMDIERVGNYFHVSHKHYIEVKVGSKVESFRSVKTPMPVNSKIRTAVRNPDNDSLLPFTGAIRYIADRARPDMLVSCGEVSSGGADEPSNEHLKIADRMISYLLTTADRYMSFGGESQLTMFGYSDAAYTTAGSSKCRIGGCIFYNFTSGAVLSYSRTTIVKLNQVGEEVHEMDVEDDDDVDESEIGRSSTLSHSSAETEIYGIDEMTREIIHQRDINNSMELNIAGGPTPIIVDTKSGIDLVTTLKSGHKTKHINMRINFIRQCINDKIVTLWLTTTEKNVADALTKQLVSKLHDEHMDVIMCGHKGVNPFAFTSIVILE
jgi:hypothetical protein